MIIKRRWGSILVLGALVTCLAGTALAAGQATSSGYHEFTMTANDQAFDPGMITVKKGEKVRLIITATDCDHGFKLTLSTSIKCSRRATPKPLNSPPTRPERLNSSAPCTAARATGK